VVVALEVVVVAGSRMVQMNGATKSAIALTCTR